MAYLAIHPSMHWTDLTKFLGLVDFLTFVLRSFKEHWEFGGK